MILALILVPAVAGVLAFAIRNHLWRRALLVAAAATHAILTAVAALGGVVVPPVEGSLNLGIVVVEPVEAGWLVLDGVGLLFLGITSALFLVASIYTVGYLARESTEEHRDMEEGLLFANAPEAIFSGCFLLFLSTMTLVTVSHHFGLLWVGIEATTLATAPLIYFHRHHRSLEAAWKYLLICSVGIALALLGNFFLAVGATREGGVQDPLVLRVLLSNPASMNIPWLKGAFLCLLVGYGTKMGLAPMHTWLPDAHSEAPSVISALLSGALLNCAFLGILRAQQVLAAAGQAQFGKDLLVGFGLLSMGVAAAFIVRQADYKRMLAYSSVEHMGILALGVGLGGAATFGAVLHTLNHSLTKAMLFLVAGNILAVYRTKSAEGVRAVSRTLPISGFLWLAGFLAITGSPPFGPFLSEFTILNAALSQQRVGVAVAYLALLALVFVGMTTIMVRMAQGALAEAAPRVNEPLLSVLPPAILAIPVLVMGIYIPPPFSRALHEIARALGGS
jgi:hydrogenase-4 component F